MLTSLFIIPLLFIISLVGSFIKLLSTVVVFCWPAFFFSFLEETEILLSFFVPVMIYHNPDTDKSRILLESKGKTGIYLWTHKESGKIYIGSAFDLSKRLKDYFSTNYLKRSNSYICNAIGFHTHSAFYLSIIEYIYISDKSSEEARKFILSREQYYLDFLFLQEELNTYNILKEAGSLLGYKHTEGSLAKFSGEYHPRGMQGKIHTAETKTLMSEAKIGITYSAEVKTRISEAHKGKLILQRLKL